MLLDDNGNIYRASGIIDYRPYEYDLFITQKDKDRFVLRLDSKNDNHIESTYQNLLYSINTDITIDGIHYIAIMVSSPLTHLEDSLSITSYNGDGYTTIIDSEGNYLINKNYGAYSYTKRLNIFDMVETGEISFTEDIQQIIADAKNPSGKTTTLIYNDKGTAEEHIIHIDALNLEDWFLIAEIPKTVYSEQSSQFKIFTLLFLSISAAGFITLFIIIWKIFHTIIAARAESKARFDFLSNMSHEIRTPLNGIIGLIQLAKLHKDNPARVNENVEKMDQSAQYLLSLVNDILDISKLEAGKVEINTRPTSLEAFLDNVYSIEKPVMDKHNINFIITKTLLHPNVLIDERAVKQIMINIIGNAAKFTPENGTITFTITQENDTASIVNTTFIITDTGCGMSKEFCDKIFDEFSQDRSANENSQKGTGLGMAISYRLTKAMGGDISVESEIGRGTTFSVTIPAKIIDEAQVKESIKVMETLPALQKDKLHILLAEDNEINAEILIELFEDENIPIDHALNGKEAVTKFSNSKPGEYNIILMDIQMPIMDGYEATRAIRALDHPDAKTVYIFACTANSFEENKVMAFDAGMDDFLTKPIDIRILLDKISKVTKNEIKNHETN